MPATIPVGTTPIKISGTASKPYLITNDPASASVIYLGQNSNVSPYNYGIKLTPGSNLTWQEINSEVWAVTISGSSTVTVLYEATATVSGQTNNLASVYPDLLQTLTIPFTFATGGTNLDQFLNTQLIQNYAGIRIMLSVNITTPEATGVLDLTSGAYVQFSGIQANTLLSNSTTAYQETNGCLWTFGDGNGGIPGLAPAIQTYDFPVLNNYLTSSWIRYSVGSSVTTVVGTITIRVFGLYNVVVPQERYQNYTGNNRRPIWGALYNSTFATSLTNVPIATQNGEAVISLATNAITPTSVNITLSFWGSNATVLYPFYRLKLDTPGTLGDSKTNMIILPNAPVYLNTVFAGTGSAILSLIGTKR